MNVPDRPYRQTTTTQPWVTVALGLLVVCAFLVFTERAADVAFPLVIVLGIALLAAHSVELRVDRLGVEIRVGNGWRRLRVALDDVVDWRIEEDAPVWGLGGSDDEGTRRIGLGAPEALRLHTRQGDVVLGLTDASEAAAAIDAWRAARPEPDELDEQFGA